MEFLDGTWKKEVTSWEALLGEELLDQEVVLEGAVHSIRNMGDVAFVILRRREGLFQTVVENEKANLSIHDLKEAMTLRVKGILNAEERAPHGREIRIREIEILSQPAEPMPLAIDKWKLNTSLEAKLNLRPIALRNIQERSKDRGKRSRGWSKPFQIQLLPQTGGPRTEPAVLQTDDGRCV